MIQLGEKHQKNLLINKWRVAVIKGRKKLFITGVLHFLKKERRKNMKTKKILILALTLLILAASFVNINAQSSDNSLITCFKIRKNT